MSVPIAIYVASVLGAVGVWLMMPRASRGRGDDGEGRGVAGGLGGLLAAAALGGLWLYLSIAVWGDRPGAPMGIEPGAMRFYYVFSALALFSAVKVITHTRPVYAALWFVMVVISSAGLFVVAAAEFMAFAMLIIYAGAILVTYVFVLMLASQSADDDDPRSSPLYDRASHEPTWAVAAGFVLLASLLSVMFEPITASQPGPSDAELIAEVLPERRSRVLAERLPDKALPGVTTDRLSNTERVGLDLFMGHPLAIELAGAVLLVSLIGSVQIARTRVPEEEQRMREGGPTSDASGATASPTREPGPLSAESQAQYGDATQQTGIGGVT